MTSSKLNDLAIKAWEKSKYRRARGGKKCRQCFDKWAKKGSESAKEPPIFPVDYKGKCPACGSQLSNFIPF